MLSKGFDNQGIKYLYLLFYNTSINTTLLPIIIK